MLANTSLISCCCNISSFPVINNNRNFLPREKAHAFRTPKASSQRNPRSISVSFNTPLYRNHYYYRADHLRICRWSPETQSFQDHFSAEEEEDNSLKAKNDEPSGGGGEDRDWTTSILLFVFWGGLIYYVSFLAPNQTPSMDAYLLQKLLNLKGDDGFQVNQLLLALWYIMGLWPLIYSMLLLPTGRSSKSTVPVWPFLVLSCFAGAYALIPYFVLWKPPPPPIEETELRKWPLNFLESKLTAGITMVVGLGLIAYAGLSSEDVFKEFYQYFRGSKFIHLTSIDFSLLSAFAPFWVYNDMTARKWYDKGFWLLPLSVVPYVGPALYLLLRPSLLPRRVSLPETTAEGK